MDLIVEEFLVRADFGEAVRFINWMIEHREMWYDECKLTWTKEWIRNVQLQLPFQPKVQKMLK